MDLYTAANTLPWLIRMNRVLAQDPVPLSIKSPSGLQFPHLPQKCAKVLWCHERQRAPSQLFAISKLILEDHHRYSQIFQLVVRPPTQRTFEAAAARGVAAAHAKVSEMG